MTGLGNAAAAGLGIAALAAPPEAAPLLAAASLLAPVAEDVLHRTISSFQRRRIDQVIRLAIERCDANVAAGDPLRIDGFFMNEPSGRNPGKEAIEGVLLVAQNSYEERKIPYLANLLAAIATDPVFSSNLANHCISVAQELSWTQYVLLAAVKRRESISLPPIDVESSPSPESWSVLHQLRALSDTFGLVGFPTTPTNYPWKPSVRVKVSDLIHLGPGDLMHQALGLDSIGALDIAVVLKAAEDTL